ncbi:TPA: helix-turn-helix transcriptional regulator [Pseudomonas aeruginosa]|nr:helix-turn-helix transcriptional regulator [Pseudomonas aeruginosa]
MSVEAWTGPALPHPLQQEQRCVPATMISFWNAPPGSPSADLRPFVELACALGGEGFPAALLETLGHWVAARHFNVLRIGAPRPELLLAGTRHRDAQLVWRCWQAYSRYYHSHDPLFLRMQRQRRGPVPLLGHLLAEDIEFDAYREAIYRDNGLSERLSSLHWDEEGRPLLFNLYRHREDGYFSEREIAAFEQWVPALLQLLRGHLALRRGRSATDEWRLALLHRATDLTPQELAVCLHLLRGLSHAGIAAELGLKESTVKTYRNRAFARLDIHFRSQLFALVQD